MKISKTTFSMAAKRGITLELGTAQDKLGRDFPALLIHGHWQSDTMAFYRFSDAQPHSPTLARLERAFVVKPHTPRSKV